MSTFKLGCFCIVILAALAVPLSGLHAQSSIDFPRCFSEGPNEVGMAINTAKKLCAQYNSCGAWGGSRTVVPFGWTKYDLSCSNSRSPKPELLQRCSGATLDQIDVQQCCAAIGYTYTALNTTPCLTVLDMMLRYILPSAIFICSLLFAIVALGIKRVVARKPLQKKWREFFIYWVIGIILATMLAIWFFLREGMML